MELKRVAVAREHAEARRPLAEAIDNLFGEKLNRGLDFKAQELWLGESRRYPRKGAPPAIGDHSKVYDDGQFSGGAEWTVTTPPLETHLGLLNAWEFVDEDVTRWLLPVRADARVFEIHRADDWARLVAHYPAMKTPGTLVPDWAAVAEHYDGVHLSWAGYLTSEGYANNIDGNVVMLRFWFSERTHWLHDAFDEPTPLAGPHPRDSRLWSVDARTDEERRRRDLGYINARLGRPRLASAPHRSA